MRSRQHRSRRFASPVALIVALTIGGCADDNPVGSLADAAADVTDSRDAGVKDSDRDHPADILAGADSPTIPATCVSPSSTTNDPLSEIQFIMWAYQTLIGRDPSGKELELHLTAIRSTATRASTWAAIKPSGATPVTFIKRVHTTLFERAATSAEVSCWQGRVASGLSWLEVFNDVLASAEYGAKSRIVMGVHLPIPIDPAVQITNADFLRHAYQLLLGRSYDTPGLRTNLLQLELGMSRAAMFASVTGSGEFKANPALADKARFVKALYLHLLGRTPTASEVSQHTGGLKTPAGGGAGQTWFEAYQGFLSSAEFKKHNCHTSYFTYGKSLPRTTALLRDWIAGRAKVEALTASKVLALTFSSASGVKHIWDNKLAWFIDPETSKDYAFTRGLINETTHAFNIFLLTSSATGVQQVGAPLFSRPKGNESYYDPHLAVDYSVCPARHVMVMECAHLSGSTGVTACEAHSTTPTRIETWSAPRVVVPGCTPSMTACGGVFRSSSTATLLFDYKDTYISWTEVDDRKDAAVVEGNERTSTSATAVSSIYTSTLSAAQFVNAVLLPAAADIHCKSPWDCNNIDFQDWLVEGAFSFGLYNGANYFRCLRDKGDASTNQWGISLAWAEGPVGSYKRLPQSEVLFAERSDICGISYPTIHYAGNHLLIDYAHIDKAGYVMRRSRVVWN